MVQLHCPCCGKLIEVNPDKGGTIVMSSCLESEEAPPTAPKEGPFFDKTLHPPQLAQKATDEELNRFKKVVGELPIGSAFIDDDGSELPVEEEPTYERDAQGKTHFDIKKIISDYPLEEDEDDD